MLEKVLVITYNYPISNADYNCNFIHTRNKHYKEKGIVVDVMSFSVSSDYFLDGIKVHTISSIICNLNYYSDRILICHAPNSQVYHFLKKYGSFFKRILFFFHGNEVLFLPKYAHNIFYSKSNKPYLFYIRNMIKTRIMKNLIIKFSNKSRFIFVSQWMIKHALLDLKIKEEKLLGSTDVIYNCIGDAFANNSYNPNGDKEFDFITIRGGLDTKKYCLDIVYDIAMANPDLKFLVIGRGTFFDRRITLNNITLINRPVSHEESLRFINNAKVGLMPTRHDSQGVMLCEMASFGIPIITSNIEVCHEALDGFMNYDFIDNDDYLKEDYKKLIEKLVTNYDNSRVDKYCMKNTCDKEIEIIKNEMRYYE